VFLPRPQDYRMYYLLFTRFFCLPCVSTVVASADPRHNIFLLFGSTIRLESHHPTMLRLLRNRRLEGNKDDCEVLGEDEQESLILESSESKPPTGGPIVSSLQQRRERRRCSAPCKRWRYIFLLGLLSIAAIQISQNPYRIARHKKLFGQLIDIFHARFISDHRPDFWTCTGGCLEVSEHKCLGKSVSLHPGVTRGASGWEDIQTSPLDFQNIQSHATTTVNGTLIYMHDKRKYIVNAFHHTLWNVLAYGSMPDHKDLTIAYKIENLPWIEHVVLLAADVYGWHVMNMINHTSSNNSIAANNNGWLCTDNNNDNSNVMIVGEGDSLRDYAFSELPRIRNELRAQALERTLQPPNATTVREQIVFFTRQNMTSRVIRNVEILVDLFREDLFDIRLVHRLPLLVEDRITLFAAADLLIAPSGVWAPNVLWMKDGACMVELQQYRLNSWLRRYGMESLFERGHLITLTDNYFNKSEPDKKWIPRQWGGLDDFQGELVAPDLKRALRRSRKCSRFLK